MVWLTATVALGTVTGGVLSAVDPPQGVTDVLLQYGVAGVFLIILLGVVRALYAQQRAQWERERTELIERCDKAETAVTELNDVIQREVLGALTESQRAVRDAIAELRQR